MSQFWPRAKELLVEYIDTETWQAHFEAAECIESGDTFELVAKEASAQLTIQRDYGPLLNSVLEHVAKERGTSAPRLRVTYVGMEQASDSQLSLFGEAAGDSTVTEARVDQAALTWQVGSPTRPAAPAPYQHAPLPEEQEPTLSPAERSQAAGLTRGMTFEKFVVGGSNEFAFGAARAVAESPGAAYNPLVIYGGVGLGKTHLLQAVGHQIILDNPTARVRYLSGESFVNQLVQSIQQNQNIQFRQKTRDEVDVLLIDDIQFIAGKERTQEEFFNIFNALHQAGKQIVVTSDRIPVEIHKLEERIQSRLNMGLITDVQPPDLETRMAIVGRRAEELDISFSEDVTEVIARTVRANVRELHGALNLLSVFSKYRKEPLTKSIAREQLARLYRDEFTRPSAESVLKATVEYFHLRKEDILGRRRTKNIAGPRKIAMFLAKKHVELSYPELGKFFGGRDHTTVLSACRSIEKLIVSDFEVRQAIGGIERALGVD